jgi:hypothetical protein
VGGVTTFDNKGNPMLLVERIFCPKKRRKKLTKKNSKIPRFQGKKKYPEIVIFRQ